MKINVLPIEIANMIAAGEVVERPASVIKELVENSIDAGATAITVEIKKGGITYMRVTDDGCGIAPDEVLTAFLRHATSKIKTAEDLNSIYTLGFRGEALASIAAVARVEIFSKTRDFDLGRCAVIEGGEVLENDEAGCTDGTTVIVRNLFFNTPARMKFLKNDATETGYVTDVINKMILNHPEVSIKFINNGKTVINSSGNGKLISSIYSVFGRDYEKNMTEVNYSDDAITVTGFVGNSRLARKDRRHQIFFVNSRNISSQIMNAAVCEAYRNTVMVGRFPVCILKIELNGNLVDVNVHPTKMQVRFSDEKKVYQAVYWAVKNALNDKKYVPEVEIAPKKTAPATGKLVMNAPSFDKAEQLEINYLKNSYVETPLVQSKPKTAEKDFGVEKIEPNASFERKPVQNSSECQSPKNEVEITRKPQPEPIEQSTPQTEDNNANDEALDRFNHLAQPSTNVMSKKLLQNLKNAEPVEDLNILPDKQIDLKANVDFTVVGQIFGTYIIVQKGDAMLLIDQHAAHERIYFENLVKEFEDQGISSQLLLLPVTMTVSPVELDICENNREFFEALGFEVDLFGENSIIVRSVPGVLEEQDIKDTLSEIITLIAENNTNIGRALAEEALHTVACKRALKGNHVLNKSEMNALAEQVLAFGDGINTCPHGRPIMIQMTKYSLEKQFKRII